MKLFLLVLLSTNLHAQLTGVDGNGSRWHPKRYATLERCLDLEKWDTVPHAINDSAYLDSIIKIGNIGWGSTNSEIYGPRNLTLGIITGPVSYEIYDDAGAWLIWKKDSDTLELIKPTKVHWLKVGKKLIKIER